MDFGNQTTKVQQITNSLASDITSGKMAMGDPLPSINQLSASCKVSRDTIFKAFRRLQEMGLIDSTPGKGYYVTNRRMNVLLLLDQYSEFKVTLYENFTRRLPADYKVDLLFHQYSERLFNTIIRESLGRYNKYVVMNFDNEKFSTILGAIDQNKLLLLDFGKFDKTGYSYICQDFDESFYHALSSLRLRLAPYRKFIFVYPPEILHPRSCQQYFIRFCEETGKAWEICTEPSRLHVEKGIAYMIIKQQNMVSLIQEGRRLGYKLGSDYGLVAYNDIPTYQIIEDGITALTIDWEMMGARVADFVVQNRELHEWLPTEVRFRRSL